MLDQYSRTRLIYGADAMDRLRNSRIAIFGIGGVGGYVAEGLVRSGVGEFDIIDDDVVCLTNCNRQIIATCDTVGRPKVEVMKERMLSIDPDVKVHTHQCFYLPDTADQFDFSIYDYVIDAVDTVTAKISIIMKAKESGVRVISCMGAGNKIDPSLFRVADIYKTSMDPLAKVMRTELRRRGIDSLKVVYSEEKPVRTVSDMSSGCRLQRICPPEAQRKCTGHRDVPGSTAFTPSVAGLIIASEVVKDITGVNHLPDGSVTGRD